MTDAMREHLQPWYDRWLDANAGTKKFWVNHGCLDHGPQGPSLHQVHFVRDTLASLVWQDVPYESRAPGLPRNIPESAFVVGEHTSKSVRLPVYQFIRPTLGLILTARYNFHDWNLSVASTRAVGDWRTGFGDDLCCFEGFPDNCKYGPRGQDPRRFSLALGNEYELYAFIRTLMNERLGRR